MYLSIRAHYERRVLLCVLVSHKIWLPDRCGILHWSNPQVPSSVEEAALFVHRTHQLHECTVTPKRGLTPASSSGTLVTSLLHRGAKNMVLVAPSSQQCWFSSTGDPEHQVLSVFTLLLISSQSCIKTASSPLPHSLYVTSAALHKRLSHYIYPTVSSMEMKLIGWVSRKCAVGREGVRAHKNRHMFTNAALQLRWIFLTRALLWG